MRGGGGAEESLASGTAENRLRAQSWSGAWAALQETEEREKRARGGSRLRVGGDRQTPRQTHRERSKGKLDTPHSPSEERPPGLLGSGVRAAGRLGTRRARRLLSPRERPWSCSPGASSQRERGRARESAEREVARGSTGEEAGRSRGRAGGRPSRAPPAEDLWSRPGSKDGLRSPLRPLRPLPGRPAVPRAIPAIINFCLIRVIVQTWVGQYD